MSTNYRHLNNALASTIREVFSYISRFKGQLFILKIEDSLLDNPAFPVLIRDIVQLHNVGIKFLIIPGTRTSIDRQLDAYGLKSSFKNGIRLTSEEALPLVEQASLGAAQRVLSHLTANGINGIQGNWVQARSLGVVEGTDYMRTGKIERIERSIIEKLLQEGFIPILPPIGWNKLGHAYNISSTELATELCRYLVVGKLFFIGEESGIKTEGLIRGELTKKLELSDHGLISAVDIDQATEILKTNHQLPFAQREYLENSIKACRNGVKRVHLLCGITQGSILQEVFSSRGNGTMVYANEYWNLRLAAIEDIPDMLRIMQTYVERRLLISRSQEDIEAKLGDYVVYAVDNAIHGCGALHAFENNSYEVAAIAVGTNYKDSGIGEAVVNFLIEKAKNQGAEKLFLLTTQASDWFYTLGFKDGTLDDLPKSKKESYDINRNSKIMVMEV
ncbi:MAG: amino-acid N-acetyltransferase [Fibromonadaceae bacterium]|jgi:amino-acid N-acetyltransferase|nr:amino-acid N-acetyltransferase [Fibromonadaceae bacterium]